MVRIAVRTITFNCLKGISILLLSRSENEGHRGIYGAAAFAGLFPQAGVLRDGSGLATGPTPFRCVSVLLPFHFREYSKASQLAESISDECFILHDLAACSMSCVSSCVMETISNSLLHHLCFPSIEREIVSPQTAFPYSIGFRTALFVLPLVLQAMPTISLACCASSVLNARKLPETLWRRSFSSRCRRRCRR